MDTARRLRLKHTASSAESAAATLENLRINIVVNHCESQFTDEMPEEFGNALAFEVAHLMRRVRKIYSDLDHLAMVDESTGDPHAAERHRLAHKGAEPQGVAAAA